MDVDITDNTDLVKEIFRQAKEQALEAIGLKAESYAKMLCPVDTGNLSDRITHDKDNDSAYVGTNVDYAPYVEFGTVKMRAQPYLKPAAQNHGDEYMAIAKSYLQNA